MIEKNVKGLAELQKFMDTLPPKLEANVMRSALRAGTKLIKESAVQNAPVKSGRLRDSIRITTRSRGGRVSAFVKAGGKKAFYAKWIEFGTAAHDIVAKAGKNLFFGGIFAEKVRHPGSAPKPFLRPALDAQSSAAIAAAGNYIKSRLETKHGIDTSSVEIEIE